MGWMGILKMYQWMYYVAHKWEVNAPLKPRCICCKDIQTMAAWFKALQYN